MLNGASSESMETQEVICASSYSAVIISGHGSDAHIAGDWFYDDEVNGIFPGPPLSSSDSEEYIEARRIPSGYWYKVRERDDKVHGKEFMDTPIWERGTYVPEDLVLVKGPTRALGAFERERSGGRETSVDVLVLAEIESEVAKYRRVGVGRIASWNKEVESTEVLTIV